MFCLGTVLKNLSRLFYAGEIPKSGNGNVFFLNKWVRFAREDKTVATYSTTTCKTQTPTFVEVLPLFTPCWWMNTSTARQEYTTLVKFCTLCTELQTDAAPMLLWFVGCQNSTTFKLAPLGMRGARRNEHFLFRRTISGPTVVVPEFR